MWWFVIPGVVIGLALAALAVIVVRKFPELAIIDVATIARERDASVKKGIIAGRAERFGKRWALQLKAAVGPAAAAVHAGVRDLAARAADLEKQYRHIGMAAGSGEKVAGERQVRELMEQAQAHARAGRASDAESAYIHVISKSPKYVKAYEELGRLYMREKQWKEAEETFHFLLKLDAKDASVLANLGELETARGELTAALVHYRAAVALKPANPKYLDLLLDAAISAGDRDLARETFSRLKESNAENNKLTEFETRIREMPAAADAPASKKEDTPL